VSRILSFFIFFQASLLFSQEAVIVSAKEYMRANAKKFALNPHDIENSRISDFYYSEKNNIHFVYFQQQVNKLDIFNAITPIAVHDNGRVINSGSSFISNASQKIRRNVDALSSEKALSNVLAHLKIPAPIKKATFNKKKGNIFATKIPEIATGEIIVEKLFYPQDQELTLAWRIEIDSKFSSDMISVFVDAEKGSIIHELSHTIKCNPKSFLTQPNNEPYTSVKDPLNSKPLNKKGDGAQYLVYPYYTESPNHGRQELLVDPSDDLASPFGWHDTNGRTGPETQITKGNNAHAFQDTNDTDSSSGDEPDGGTDLIFNFPHDQSLDVTETLDSDVTQLFYMGNVMHDWSYNLGFDEASGNYQENNLMRGGPNAEDGDPVNLNALDGYDTGEVDNANFTLTSDGRSGKMQLFNFQARGKDLWVLSPAELVTKLLTGFATFGPGRVTSNLEGKLVLAIDDQGDVTDACDNIQNAAEMLGNIALIRRGECFFSEKVYNVQQYGAKAAIVCNNRPDQIINMGGADDAELVTIPGYFIYKEDCDPLEKALNEGEDIELRFVPNMVRNISSGFDNGIIAHEYAHGISGRLTGGPSSPPCLNNDEQMGEGWSDFIALVITQQEDAKSEDARGIGTYVSGTRPNGTGFRNYRYSTDLNINPQTLNDIRGTGTSPHPLGEIWAATLWDMYWLFIDEYGYDFTWENVNSGNYKAVQLVLDGMRLQPCSPGFIQGRDAILAADEMNFDGIHKCLIWKAFAKRGIGINAFGGSTQNRNDNVEGFQTLPTCLITIKLEKSTPPIADVNDTLIVSIAIANHTDDQIINAILENTLPSNAEYIPGSANLPSIVGSEGTSLTIPLGDISLQQEISLSYSIKIGTEKLTSRIAFDDFGPGNNLFANSTSTGVNNEWKLTSSLKRLGDNSFNIINDTLATSGTLTQTLPITLVQENPGFSFWHRYVTEYGYDGGILELSEDGGETWSYIANDKLLVNDYPVEMINNRFGLDSKPKAFTGNVDNWVQTFVDLSSYKGKEVMMRFRWASDADQGVSGPLSGWYIDYVEYVDLAEILGSSCISSDNQEEVCASARTLLRLKEGSTVTNEVTKAEYDISVYPNPSSSEISVRFEIEKRTAVNISINDLQGRLIESSSDQYHTGKNEVTLNTSALPDGIYLVQVRLGENLYNQKFIKLKK